MDDGVDDGPARGPPEAAGEHGSEGGGERGSEGGGEGGSDATASEEGLLGHLHPSLPGLPGVDVATLPATLRTGVDRAKRAETASDPDAAPRSRGFAGWLVSLRHFAAILVAGLAGAIVFGELLPWSGPGNLLGVFLAAAGVGLGARGRHYLEATVAGTLTAGLGAAVTPWLLSLPVFDAPVTFGLGAAAAAGLLGHHAGRVVRALLRA